MRVGTQALLIFRELGHRPTEGTVAYRLSAVARGLGRPRAARRYADVAIDAGRSSDTRTTIAIGTLDLARLDLDTGDARSAATHLLDALDHIDPDADRWVLVDALEAAARLLVTATPEGREVAAVTADTAATLVAAAGRIRIAIHQPIAPTEAADLAWTAGRLAPGGDAPPTALRDAARTPMGPADARDLTVAAVRETLATSPADPTVRSVTAGRG